MVCAPPASPRCITPLSVSSLTGCRNACTVICGSGHAREEPTAVDGTGSAGVRGRARSHMDRASFETRQWPPARSPRMTNGCETDTAVSQRSRCRPGSGAIRLSTDNCFPPFWPRCPHRCDVRPALSSSPPWRSWPWW
ncbi:hypothetical protein GQL56_12910 [Pseudomonas putida]|nr:hypothetical protein [Pseudomonas putida]